MTTLYDFMGSGNGYKVRLLLHQLSISYERIPVDILRGESRTPDFLDKNPNGRVPLLVTPAGEPLAESNAILFYLAETHGGDGLLPPPGLTRARMLQWMFFEQYSHEPYIATNRFYLQLAPDPDAHRAAIAANHPKGVAALSVMERHLEGRTCFVGDRYTIADIALFAYTHVAHGGGYDLTPFPNIRRWCETVQQEPRHIGIHA